VVSEYRIRLPVRFSSRAAADQWITQRLEVDRRVIVKKPQKELITPSD
jgi:hypothetical protein